MNETSASEAASQEAMSDGRLEQLAGLADLPCTCGDADCGNYTSALTAEEAQELVAEARRARVEGDGLRKRLRRVVTAYHEDAASDWEGDSLDRVVQELRDTLLEETTHV